MWSPASTATAASIPTATTASTAAVNGLGPSRDQQTNGVWSFDSDPFDSNNNSVGANTNNSNANVGIPPSINTNVGVIGSGYIPSRVSKSRMLWNRTAPEEEEREEEALPSYLTYLQPSFRSSGMSGLNGGGERIPSSGLNFGAWGDASPSIATTSGLSANSSHFVPSSPFGALSPHAGPFVSASSMTATTVTYAAGGNGANVETKTKELAFALQEFVRQQIEHQQIQQNQQNQQRHQSLAPTSSATNGSPPLHRGGACDCEPLKLRVADLEHKLLTLSHQVGGLLSAGGGAPPGATAHAMAPPPLPPTPPPLSAGGGPGLLRPLASPPPSPALPSSTTVDSPTGDAAVSGINDRVSTLEGRQSAFQSQLAQISKVLGVPIGKHGKNTQIKNLVQTLRDEIDTKLTTSAKEMEAKCIQTVAQEVDHVVARAMEEHLQNGAAGNGAGGSSSGGAGGEASPPSPPTHSQLSYDDVFGALAEEHEASLGKLSAYFEDRLAQETKQRMGLESRIQSRFGEHEEWLQQLEGEFGSWHDRSSTVATQLRLLQKQIHEMDDKWANEQLKWAKQAADLVLQQNQQQNGSAPGSAPGSASGSVVLPSQAATATTTTTSTTTTVSVDSLTRSVHQLQVQYKQFHSEYKTETSSLRENVVLMDTWVKSSRQETRDLAKNVKGMKQLVEKLVRDTGSAEELLQQYVSTITHQVASVTRQYVSVRIRDNNRLIDATLRARVPSYVANESESFMLVRPEKKLAAAGASSIQDENQPPPAGAMLLKEDDEEGLRNLLQQQQAAMKTESSSPSKSDTKY